MGEPVSEGFAAQFELVPQDDTDTPVVYANFVQATVSPLDMTLHLGWYALPPLAEEPAEPVNVPIRPVLKVSVPINLVPGIIRVLQAQFGTWEETFSRGERESTEA